MDHRWYRWKRRGDVAFAHLCTWCAGEDTPLCGIPLSNPPTHPLSSSLSLHLVSLSTSSFSCTRAPPTFSFESAPRSSILLPYHRMPRRRSRISILSTSFALPSRTPPDRRCRRTIAASREDEPPPPPASPPPPPPASPYYHYYHLASGCVSS